MQKKNIVLAALTISCVASAAQMSLFERIQQTAGSAATSVSNAASSATQTVSNAFTSERQRKIKQGAVYVGLAGGLYGAGLAVHHAYRKVTGPSKAELLRRSNAAEERRRNQFNSAVDDKVAAKLAALGIDVELKKQAGDGQALADKINSALDKLNTLQTQVDQRLSVAAKDAESKAGAEKDAAGKEEAETESFKRRVSQVTSPAIAQHQGQLAAHDNALKNVVKRDEHQGDVEKLNQAILAVLAKMDVEKANLQGQIDTLKQPKSGSDKKDGGAGQ